MIITAAFLAEAAAVVDGKLHVWGGMFTRYTVGPDRLANVVLVLFTRDENGNGDPTVQVEVRPPDGSQSLEFEFPVPQTTATAEIGFAFQNIQLGLPQDGRWEIDVRAREAGPLVTIPLEVGTMTPQPAQ